MDNAFLVSLVGLRPEKYFWLGLSNQKNIDNFLWTNGQLTKFSHWNTGMPGMKGDAMPFFKIRAVYSNSTGYPKFSLPTTPGYQQGCVAITTGLLAGLWDLLPCNSTEKFICKHLAEGAVPTVPPPTQSPPKCADGWSRVGSRNYCSKVQQEILAKNKWEKQITFNTNQTISSGAAWCCATITMIVWMLQTGWSKYYKNHISLNFTQILDKAINKILFKSSTARAIDKVYILHFLYCTEVFYRATIRWEDLVRGQGLLQGHWRGPAQHSQQFRPISWTVWVRQIQLYCKREICQTEEPITWFLYPSDIGEHGLDFMLLTLALVMYGVMDRQ